MPESETQVPVWARPGRSVRPSLDREQIVAMGIKIADDEGIEALSMRRVATGLDAGTMSLYRYVPKKEDLIDLMVDEVAGADWKPEDLTGDWREDLRTVARSARSAYKRHPWALTLGANRPRLGPNTIRTVDRTLALLDGIGLDSGTMTAVIAAVNAYVVGMVQAELAEVEVQRRRGMSPEEWQAAIEPYIEQVVASGEYPKFSEHVLGGEQFDPERSFEFGLDRLIDGIAAFVDALALVK